MKSPAFLSLVGLLCLCFYHSVADSRACETYGLFKPTKLFFGDDIFFRIYAPCRAKMANVQCGGSPTLIIAEHSMKSFYKRTFVTAVSVNITTTNADGTVTYQILDVTNDALTQYEDEGDFGKSPWTWRYEGSEVDESKKLVGYYNQSSGYAVLVNGGLTIEYDSLGKYSHALLRITCSGDEFKAIESYPETICGGPENSQADHRALNKQLHLDRHHYAYRMFLDYLVFTNRNVQQTSPMCQEASNIVTGGTCSEYERKVFACYSMQDTGPVQYGECMRYYMDADSVFKFYVACLRALCGTENARSEDTCDILQRVNDTCESSMKHTSVTTLLARANCPSIRQMPATTPAPIIENSRWTWDTWSCTVRDKWRTTNKRKQLNPATAGLIGYHYQRMRVDLPCRYRLANLQCHGKQVVVETGHSLDVDEVTYVSDIIVKIGETGPDGTTTYQINKLSLSKLKKFIKAGNFKKRLWKWSYTGGKKLARKNRSVGKYDDKSKSAILTYGALTVNYTNIDPHSTVRSEGNQLTIDCEAGEVKANDYYPDAVCDTRQAYGSYYMEEHLPKSIQTDYHHRRSQFLNPVLMAIQNVTQKSSQCREVLDIVSGGACKDLHEQLYECHRVTAIPVPGDPGYGQCIRDNNLGVFKVYVSCLRALCGTDRAGAKDTCYTLRKLDKVCGDNQKATVHMTASELLSRADCS